MILDVHRDGVAAGVLHHVGEHGAGCEQRRVVGGSVTGANPIWRSRVSSLGLSSLGRITSGATVAGNTAANLE